MSDIHFRPSRYLKASLSYDDKQFVMEVGVVSQPEPARVAQVADSPDLLVLHESIAGLLATEGEWRQAYQHLRAALDIAHVGTMRDALTAGYNRRYLDQRLHGLLSEHQRPAGIAIALVDLDLFKHVNDTYGHLVGDHVLRQVAELLREDLPPGGFCARYGGEEFVLVMPDLDARRALTIAEETRARVARFPWTSLRPGLHVTISVGVTHDLTGGTGHATEAEHCLVRADKLLYAAKRAGRNVVAYRDHESVRVVEHSQ